MNALRNRTLVGTLLLTSIVACTLYAANTSASGKGEGRREPRVKKIKDSDDPGARARWMDQWYNENYLRGGAKSNSRSALRGIWSLQYQRFMMEAAKRERTRYASKMPTWATSKAVIDPSVPMSARAPADSPSRDLKWTNIGPTKANFIRNGVTLNVTDSGRINAIETHPANPNILYVAFSGGGLWKSTDGGALWQAKTETLGSLSVGAVEMDPNNPDTLYLGLGDPFDGTGLGIVKMTDGGDTWTEPKFLGNSTSIREIMVAPANSSIVLVATDAGLYRSVDAGKTYSPVLINTGFLATPSAWSFAHGGGNTIVMSLEAVPSASNSEPDLREGQIWRSTDNGATWTRANGATHASGVNRIELASAPSNRSVMYALASRSIPDANDSADLANIFKSTDGGANWVAMATTPTSAYKTYLNPNSDSSTIDEILNGQGWYNLMALVDPNNPNIAYFGGALLSAKTTDGGATFSILTDWLADFGLPYVHADFHAGHIAGNGTLYFGTDGGIFASSNGGTTFTHTLNEGIASHLVYNVCSTPADANRVLIGLQDNGTRLREGNTSIFNQVRGGDGFGCDVNRTNANRMISTVQYLNIRRSFDGGQTFSDACTGIAECDNTDTAPFRVSIVPWAGDVAGNVLYTHANKIVYRTGDYAAAWTALGTAGLPADLFIRAIGIAKTGTATPNIDNVVAIAASGGRVFLTADRGVSWTQAGTPPNNGLSLSSIVFDPADRNIVYLTSVAPDATKTHVWRSQNFGQTWASIDGNGFPLGVPVNAITVDPVVRTTLYASTHLGVYRSLDSGANWERLGAFLPLVNVMDISVSADGNQLRAASFGRGVWQLSAVGNNAVPVANFNVAKSNLTATFADTSTDSDGSIVRRIWNFGDGVSASATNPLHTYAAPGTYTVTLTVTDNGGYSHTRTAAVVLASGKARNDLNGDGKSDIVLWNPSISYLAYWIMNGSVYTGSGGFGVASGFAPVATGFVAPIAQTSLLARNTTSQTLYSYIWNGTAHAQGTVGGTPAGWDLIGTGDIDGDGKGDLLWRNPTTGNFAYWRMDGAVYLGGQTYSPPVTYVIAGIADFNGDGRVDLLWNDPGTRNASVWTSTGGGFSVAQIGQYGTEWNMVGTADVTGDGKADIVLRNNARTYLAYWRMDGAVYQGSSAFGLAADRDLFTTGDFDGDGLEDLVIARDSDRSLYLWRSTGAVFTESVIGQYGAEWSVIR